MKALSVALDLTALTANSRIGVPITPAGLTTGYYTDPNTGIKYYYNASLDQWYVVSGLNLIPLALTWAPSPSSKLELTLNNTLRFNLALLYQGPAMVKTFYAAIGNNSKSGSFEEWTLGSFTTQVEIAIPACATPTQVTGKYVDLKLTSLSGHEGQDGAAYCKILNGVTFTTGVNITPLYYDVCHIIPSAGEITDLAIVSFVKL